tara:strand:- start:89 stop:511 length:423 start_codon:yes stop_codon:yes gene_type:complete
MNTQIERVITAHKKAAKAHKTANLAFATERELAILFWPDHQTINKEHSEMAYQATEVAGYLARLAHEAADEAIEATLVIRLNNPTSMWAHEASKTTKEKFGHGTNAWDAPAWASLAHERAAKAHERAAEQHEREIATQCS